MWIHPCTIEFKSAKQKKQNTRKYCILFTGSFLGCKHIQLLNDCKKDKAKIYQANQYMYIENAVLMEDSLKKIGRNFNYFKIVTKVHITLSHHADVLPPKIESCYPGIKPKLHWAEVY